MKPPAGDSIHDLFNPQSLEVTNNLWKGHLTIQKRSQRLAMQLEFHGFYMLSFVDPTLWAFPFPRKTHRCA